MASSSRPAARSLHLPRQPLLPSVATRPSLRFYSDPAADSQSSSTSTASEGSSNAENPSKELAESRAKIAEAEKNAGELQAKLDEMKVSAAGFLSQVMQPAYQ